MKIVSRLRGWLNSVTQKGDNVPPKYVHLAPTDEADGSGIYSDALNYAISEPNISNIALTGPYGSGKSSIIKTFLKTYKKPVLQISLAAFLPEASVSSYGEDQENSLLAKSAISKQEIERSILQQMLYGADSNSLPLSRFKRIQSPKWWARFVSIFIIFGLIACWHLVQSSSEIVSGKFFQPFSFDNWLNFASLTLALLFLWGTLHHIYVKSFGFSLKSVSLKDIEIKPESAEEESILNRHLDEIIYFFQSTNYDLVVIEDLDRFNNPDIFVTLREINSLVNANAGVKRPIRFLYALRDNMFKNTDRTKFFEFIVPVIPIINSSNSIDKVIEQGKRLSLDKRLNQQFLREVSRYLNDMRLIQNIFNEYAIYVANLETDGDSILDANKLLAILIYKNVLPSDFEELHRGRGKLAEILNKHDSYISTVESRNRVLVSKLEKQISDAEKQVPADQEELRKIYAMSLASKIPEGHNIFEFEGNRHDPLHSILNHRVFDEQLEKQEIVCRSPQNQIVRIKLIGLQDEVNPEKSYQDRKDEIEQRTEKFKEKTSKTIRELRVENSKLRLKKFNEIIRTNAKDSEPLFSAFNDNEDLVRFLIFEGFLDDSFYQYTSLFHSGRLSPNDNKFLIQIRSFKNPGPDFQIDNPKEVIAAMRTDDFRQNFILNKTLVDCLFADQGEYQKQIGKLIDFISSSFSECRNFFQVYYGTGKRITELLTALNKNWPDFVSTAISSPDSLMHAAQMLAHLPESQLETLKEKSSVFSELLSTSLLDVLESGVDFEYERLSLVQFEVKELSNIEPHTAITKLIAADGKYVISIDNIEFIFQVVLGLNGTNELRTKNYSTVLKSEDKALTTKIEQEFSYYLKNVLLESITNSEEEVSTILTVINHDDIEDEYLVQFVEKQSKKLPTLEQVPVRLHTPLFRLHKFESTWQNCLDYLNSENFDAGTLTDFLKSDDSLIKLSNVKVGSQVSARPLRAYLINNNDFEDEIYRAYIRMLPRSFKNFPSEIDKEKLRILIEEKKIILSTDSFTFLNDLEDLQVEFIAKNIDAYLKQESEYEIDDDFREAILCSEIGDEQKLRIVSGMDLSLISNLPSRASHVGRVLHRTNADVSDLSEDVAHALIVHSKPVSTQIALFNKCHGILSVAQIWSIIQQLPKPYSKIEKGWGQPIIPNTPENQELVHWLEARSIISSSKLTFFDEIRIYNFRK
ncbi:YobI family P-loop NTPase [Roseibium album]|uniref:YobI-like P-loop NTPase domain-containing protein n=1 Tax=Roseibium album TaxID=311410 RepID=A0A0M6Z5U7_9HYPH|nr:P-loop NTPase fold protein [Roseibium album]CTQ58138.1 hypothetical protein LA5094_00895 [Roseibium album]CTQ65661.1 hypothetical protein LA5096_00806 [Roseibium album]CTQ70539.1 hypothetical protein LA5095_01950 [Roseibium album]